MAEIERAMDAFYATVKDDAATCGAATATDSSPNRAAAVAAGLGTRLGPGAAVPGPQSAVFDPTAFVSHAPFVRVTTVTENSPASRASLKTGDHILQV